MVTLADVAQLAGVSPSTVSYVLSGKRTISELTRQRVKAAVETLGYHPNAGARALASSRSNVIGLVIPLRRDSYVPVIMEIAMAVTTEARRFDLDVLLLTKDEGTRGVSRIVGSGMADGLIVMDVELDDERIPVLRQARIPAILIGLPADPAGLSCVDLDFDATGAACVDHLADLGHRNIAFIGEGEGVYHRRTGFAARTLAGFQRRAAQRGVRTTHRACEGTHEATAGTLFRILEERPDTTAFVVQNEAAVPSLLSLMRMSGRTIPDDVSMVVICPDQVALSSSPRLTSVSIPAAEMGARAVRMVVAQIAAAACGPADAGASGRVDARGEARVDVGGAGRGGARGQCCDGGGKGMVLDAHAGSVDLLPPVLTVRHSTAPVSASHNATAPFSTATAQSPTVTAPFSTVTAEFPDGFPVGDGG